jgi:hypothetical protein
MNKRRREAYAEAPDPGTPAPRDIVPAGERMPPGVCPCCKKHFGRTLRAHTRFGCPERKPDLMPA